MEFDISTEHTYVIDAMDLLQNRAAIIMNLVQPLSTFDAGATSNLTLNENLPPYLPLAQRF